jgi:hypothetical protein
MLFNGLVQTVGGGVEASNLSTNYFGKIGMSATSMILA